MIVSGKTAWRLLRAVAAMINSDAGYWNYRVADSRSTRRGGEKRFEGQDQDERNIIDAMIYHARKRAAETGRILGWEHPDLLGTVDMTGALNCVEFAHNDMRELGGKELKVGVERRGGWWCEAASEKEYIEELARVVRVPTGQEDGEENEKGEDDTDEKDKGGDDEKKGAMREFSPLFTSSASNVSDCSSSPSSAGVVMTDDWTPQRAGPIPPFIRMGPTMSRPDTYPSSSYSYTSVYPTLSETNQPTARPPSITPPTAEPITRAPSTGSSGGAPAPAQDTTVSARARPRMISNTPSPPRQLIAPSQARPTSKNGVSRSYLLPSGSISRPGQNSGTRPSRFQLPSYSSKTLTSQIQAPWETGGTRIRRSLSPSAALPGFIGDNTRTELEGVSIVPYAVGTVWGAAGGTTAANQTGQRR